MLRVFNHITFNDFTSLGITDFRSALNCMSEAREHLPSSTVTMTSLDHTVPLFSSLQKYLPASVLLSLFMVTLKTALLIFALYLPRCVMAGLVLVV